MTAHDTLIREGEVYLAICPNADCEGRGRSSRIASVLEILYGYRELPLPSWKPVGVFYISVRSALMEETHSPAWSHDMTKLDHKLLLWAQAASNAILEPLRLLCVPV